MLPTQELQRDANRTAIQGNQAFLTRKSMTFDGGTTNDPGDFDGTGNPATLFTVTGDILASVFAICSTLLAGASATVEVGVASGTALLLPLTTATDIDAKEAWIDNAPALVENVPSSKIVGQGQDIIQTVATANITSGVLEYYCIWRPLSTDGNLVAA